MNLDFCAILQAQDKIKIYDLSTENVPEDITSMTLKVTSSKLSDSPYEFDIVSYLMAQRESEELYTLTSDQVGLSPTVAFLDGVYHFEYIINNRYSKTHKFLIFQNIKTEIEALLVASEYKVDVGDYNMTYVDDNVNNEYDIEQVRYAMALYDKLLLYTQQPNEVEVNNLLEKLNRLLTIINT